MISENHRSRYLELQIMITTPWCDHSPRARHPKMEVKWALGSITMNKASRGDGIPVELFQILKHDAVKVLHSICQQICCLACLPRSKCVLISWLQSPSTVIFEPKVIKSVTVSIVCPSICHEMIGPDSMIFFEC